jgi:hypothetical protein
MQQNIKKTLAKANKEKSKIHKNEKTINSKKRSKPSLLRMLSSNVVSETASNTDKSKTSPAVAPLPAPSTTSVAPEALEPQRLQGEQQQPAAAQPNTKPCPLCGESIHLDIYDQHMQMEVLQLIAIDEEDADWADHCMKKSLEILDILPPSNLPPPPPRPDPKVYILGGTPSMAVPRDPKKLKPLAEEYKRQVKPVKAYNYYADGGGNMDGDEIGLDGFTNVGVGWEGVGATTF